MLGKLLKHEFRQSARSVSLIYISTLAVVAFIFFGMLTKITWIGIAGSVVLNFVAIILVTMTLVSVIKNFYETLYSNQGYLSFTLPVKCSGLLLSKLIVSIIWIILSLVFAGLCYLLLVVNTRVSMGDTLGTLSDLIELSGIKEMLPSKTVLIKGICYLVVGLFLEVMSLVGFIYFSVTTANTRLLQKHPKLFGFLLFFVTYGVTNAIALKLTYSLPLAIEASAENIKIAFVSMDQITGSWCYGIGGTLLRALVAVGLLLLTGWIMEHKVNIK